MRSDGYQCSVSQKTHKLKFITWFNELGIRLFRHANVPTLCSISRQQARIHAYKKTLNAFYDCPYQGRIRC